jgi:UDP-3-O-[3-hydroxymyristoyl] N-acetylglucosamine deacetylase
MTRRPCRATISRSIYVEGVGVHLGRPVRVWIRPTPLYTGIQFRKYGCPALGLPASIEHAESMGGATGLASSQWSVLTVEHLLSAVMGCGLTDLIIEVDGPELPILDGSAAPWVEMFKDAGLLRSVIPAPQWRILSRVEVSLGTSHAWLCPSAQFRMEVSVDYDVPWLPRGMAEWDGSFEEYERICGSRTFVLARDAARLLAEGRGRGASEKNTVLWPSVPGQVPKGLRYLDEPVGHKLIDGIGDLALAGAHIIGEVGIHRGSHRLHLSLLRALFAQPGALMRIG